MNLPTYSLSDSPVSNILNVCPALIGPSTSSRPTRSKQSQPRNSSSEIKSSRYKGKSREPFTQSNTRSDLENDKLGLKLDSKPNDDWEIKTEEEEGEGEGEEIDDDDQWQDAEYRSSSSPSKHNRPDRPNSKTAATSTKKRDSKPIGGPQRIKPNQPRPIHSENRKYSDLKKASNSNSNSNNNRKFRNLTGWDEIFCTANLEGWVVYGTYPLRVIDKKVIPNGSLKFVVALHRSNILFIVGGPPSPLYSPNKVIIYDSLISSPIYSIEFSSSVLGINSRNDKLIVVLLNRVILINLSDLDRLSSVSRKNFNSKGSISSHQNYVLRRDFPSKSNNHIEINEEGIWETCDNPKGLVCLSSDLGSNLLVFPGRQLGQVQVVHLSPVQKSSKRNSNKQDFGNSPDNKDLKQRTKDDGDDGNSLNRRKTVTYRSTSILIAHTTPLASLAITPNGSLIATASVTGTLIRIWDSRSSTLLKELRRGTDGAEVWSLRFRPDGGAICASSDKGTIHMWNLNQKPNKKDRPKEENKAVSLAILKPYLPKYFQSTWSDAYFRLPPPAPPTNRSIPNILTSLPPIPTTTLMGNITSSSSNNNESNDNKDSSSSNNNDHFTAATTTMAAAGGSNFTRSGSDLVKNPTTEDDVSLINWIVDEDFEPQIVVLTRSGGWYRLRTPKSTTTVTVNSNRTDGSINQSPNEERESKKFSRNSFEAKKRNDDEKRCEDLREEDDLKEKGSALNRLGLIGQKKDLNINNVKKKSVELECIEFQRFGEDDDWSEDEDYDDDN